MNVIESDTTGKGLGLEVVYTGGNSGYQALNLVYLFGATQIILLGYDMKTNHNKSHWHGDHPGSLNRHSNYTNWIDRFKDLARDLQEENIKVINATRETALTCFDRMTLEEALC